MSTVKFLGVIRLRSLFFLVLMFVAVVFSGCDFFGKDTDGIGPEAMLPVDSMMVMALDGADEEQVENFGDLMDKFPDKERMWDFLIKNYDETVGEKYEYDEMMEPIFDGDWKIVVGVEGGFFDPDGSVYVAGKFSEAGDLEDLIDKYFEDKEEWKFEYKKEDGVKYWSYDTKEMHIVRYGDLFVLTNKEENMAGAVAGIEGGESFAGNEEVLAKITELGEKNLGYFYMDFEVADWSFFAEDELMSDDFWSDFLMGFGEMYSVFVADEGGIASPSVAYLSEDGEDLWGGDYKSDFVNKVPGEGAFLYVDAPNSRSYIAMLFDVIDLTKWMKYEDLFYEPFAFMMNDVGAFYPATSLYIQTDESTVELAKNFVVEINGDFDELVKEFDILMLDAGERAGMLKKDIEIIMGGAFHKISFDFSLLPEEGIEQMGMGEIDLLNTKLELYYGITGDGVLAVALHPDFGEVYEQSVLADDEGFVEAMSRWADVEANQIFYLRTGPIFDVLDRSAEIFKAFGGLGEAVFEFYNDVKENMLVMEYMSGFAFVEDGVMVSDFYVKWGE